MTRIRKEAGGYRLFGGAPDGRQCWPAIRWRSDWVACALGLAHQLLGAWPDETPVAWRANHLPSWLVPAVLQEWGAGYRHRDPIVAYLRHPVRMLETLPLCWPRG